MTPRRVCVVPRVSGVGGMVSFRTRLVEGLRRRGLQVTDRLDDGPYRAVLVIGGMHDLPGLWQARRRGIPVVQRLNGMNWIHRLRRTGLKHFLRAEYGNCLLASIRQRLATRIVYQSQFSKHWWERVYGPLNAPVSVVYNGVDLDSFSPNGSGEPPSNCVRILVVEGNLAGGYEGGLESAVVSAERLQELLRKPVEVVVVGRVTPTLQSAWQQQARVRLNFSGLVKGERIPELARSSHLLYAADVNAACPNSVVEALACGLPVLAFDTGALREMVPVQAGRVVAYGGDPWKLDPPDTRLLAQAAVEVLATLPAFRSGARRWAEQVFGLDRMLDGYCQALELGND